MDIKVAAIKCRALIDYVHPHRSSDGLGLEHAAWLLWQIEDGYVSGEKAHRWLGWAQSILVHSGICSLEDMKDTNR